MTIDPSLDLTFTRTADIAPEAIWRAWTTPELLAKWFTPKPWKTSDVKLDLRIGGEFMVEMESPDGDRYPNPGCILELVPNQRLTWTSSLRGDYRPSLLCAESFPITATIEIQAADGGSVYKVTVLHASEEDRVKHEKMGFEHGWGAAFDQLIETMAAHQ